MAGGRRKTDMARYLHGTRKVILQAGGQRLRTDLDDALVGSLHRTCVDGHGAVCTLDQVLEAIRIGDVVRSPPCREC